MQLRMIACCPLMFLLACTTGSRTEPLDPAVSQATAAHWRLRVGKLDGPVDTELPSYGGISALRVCHGAGDRVAVVWVRGIWMFGGGTLEWDAALKLWRDRASGRTFAPQSEQLDPRGKPDWPSPDVVFPAGRVGMAVISPQGSAKGTFLIGVGNVGPSSLGGCLGPVLKSSDGWTAVLNLWGADGQSASEPKTVLVAMDKTGWGEARAVRKGHFDHCAQVASESLPKGFFWLESFHHRMDLPDFMGGKTRQRLNYTLLSSPNETRTVYERPYDFAESKHQIVALGPDRYDLIARRHPCFRPRGQLRDEIVHVPDLLGGGMRGATVVIPQCGPSQSVAAIARGRFLQLLWIARRSHGGDVLDIDDAAGILCLMEINYNGKTWSKPRALHDVGACSPSSLVAAIRADASDGVALAVWAGANRQLTYSVSPSIGQWSTPCHSEAQIGELLDMTLVSAGQGFFLFTATDDRRNRQWRYLELVGDESGAEKGGKGVTTE